MNADLDVRLSRLERQLQELVDTQRGERLLSDHEAAAYLRISTMTLLRMLEDAPDGCPGYPITVATGELRRSRRWRPQDLAAFCAAVSDARDQARERKARKASPARPPARPVLAPAPGSAEEALDPRQAVKSALGRR